MARKRGRGRGGGGGRAAESNCNHGTYRGIEENTLAILENSSSATFHHLLDDRLAFLEAVRSASLVPENGTAPTNKMFEAAFRILKDEDSLDLVVGSYELLSELNKRYPRVHLSVTENSELSTPSEVLPKVIIVEEMAWSPFRCNEKDETTSGHGGPIDSLGFHSLIEDIVKGASAKGCKEVITATSEGRCKTPNVKPLRNMLLFQYLVSVLEGDLIPRTCTFKENKNWTLLRESTLNIVLGSRKISYKDLVKECLSLMCDLCLGVADHDLRRNGTFSGELKNYFRSAVKLALPEVEKSTCVALKKLLLMIMELDSSRTIADMNGLISRADGVRTPAAEIILDELTYNSDMLSPFFLVFDEPEWKLKLIVQYFQNYIPKFSSRTRRSNGLVSDATFDGILKCFSNQTISKGITKKIRPEVTQLLLAHGFKAYLSTGSNHSVIGVSDAKQETEGSCLVEICENITSAFACLREEDKGCELLQISKEALFAAGTILSVEVPGVSH